MSSSFTTKVLTALSRWQYGTALRKEVTVQSIRGMEALGEPLLNLGGPASADRVLSDSFSEDWPQLRLYDLGKAPGGMHRGVGSQLVYNRESKQSLFIGALTADRLLTVLHLQSAGDGTRNENCVL